MAASSNVNEKIIQCINEGLKVFSKSVNHVIYFYLERDFQLKKTEIPEKPESFCKAITLLFGENGAKLIEESMLQKMERCFKIKHRSKSTFVQTVLKLKAKQNEAS